MSFLSKLTGIFKKKSPSPLADLPPMPDLPPMSNLPPFSAPSTNFNEPLVDNSKQKMDLVAAQMDSLRIQYDTMNERVLQIEKMVKELLDMAKSP